MDDYFRFIDSECQKMIGEEISANIDKSDNHYTIGYSVGQSQWAEIPWLAIYDDDITNSATYGYDILSFDPKTRQEKHIEVKTTRGKAEEAFYVTRNELEVSKKEKDKYYLYRVYNLNEKKNTFNFYVLQGALDEYLPLEPTQYVAGGKIKKL